jgi:hypothetical protein
VTFAIDGRESRIGGDSYGTHAVSNVTTTEVADHNITAGRIGTVGARNSIIREFESPMTITGTNGEVQLVTLRISMDSTDNSGTTQHPDCLLEGSVVPAPPAS